MPPEATKSRDCPPAARWTVEEALVWYDHYRSLGIATVPLFEKRALCQWRPRPPSREDVRHAARTRPVTGLAAILGPNSGGLNCRDFDDVDSYLVWCDSRRGDRTELGFAAPTVQTPRPGRHVYGICRAACPIIPLSDGEVRGEGGYIVLPRSRHPNGARYRWLREPATLADFPEVTPEDLVLPEQIPQVRVRLARGSTPVGVESARCQGAARRRHPEDKLTPTPPNKLCSDFHVRSTCDYIAKFVDWAVRATQPTGPRQRNSCCFDLARHLRRVFPIEAINARREELRWILRRWFRMALPVVRTKEFSVTWAGFLDAWGDVRFVAKGFFDRVAEIASGD